MSAYNTGSAYGPLSKFFHWVIAFFVILLLAVSYFLDDIPSKILKGIAFNAHKLMGLCVLGLMVLRLGWACLNPKPGLPDARRWERWAAFGVHWALYLLVLVMPLAGWIGSVAGGRPPRFGQLVLWLPIEKNPELSELCFTVHNTVAWILIGLVSVHVAAGLYHYFFKKDKVLQRMWV